jgi:hypothetical protein
VFEQRPREWLGRQCAHVEDGGAPTCGNQSGWWRRLAVAGADGGGGM